jgi:hypothetical protein
MLIKKKKLINFTSSDAIFLASMLLVFLTLAFSYNSFLKNKKYSINVNAYLISGYERRELFYIDHRVFMNIFVNQFSNPYFGDPALKKKLLNQFYISEEQFVYLNKKIRSQRISSTWNYTLSLESNDKSEKNFQLFQRYCFLINELSKIKVYNSYRNVKSSFFEVVIGDYNLIVNEQAESKILNSIPDKYVISEFPKLEVYKEFQFINKSNFKNYKEMFSKEDEYLVYGISNLDRYYLEPLYISDQFVYFLSILTSFLLFLFRLLIFKKKKNS